MLSNDRLVNKYRCARCGDTHDGPPLSYAFGAPHWWDAAFEGRQGYELRDETCILGDSHYFIRGNIELRIVGRQDRFVWTVWVSLSKDNFERALALWDNPVRANEPPYFGWLANSIPGYPESLNLKTNVHARPPGERPFVELEPTEHPLAVQQRDGITSEKILTLAVELEHRM